MFRHRNPTSPGPRWSSQRKSSIGMSPSRMPEPLLSGSDEPVHYSAKTIVNSLYPTSGSISSPSSPSLSMSASSTEHSRSPAPRTKLERLMGERVPPMADPARTPVLAPPEMPAAPPAPAAPAPKSKLSSRFAFHGLRGKKDHRGQQSVSASLHPPAQTHIDLAPLGSSDNSCGRSTPALSSLSISDPGADDAPPRSSSRQFTTLPHEGTRGQSILDISDEPECPICLEPLSLRLAGERPHVHPVCGHTLHHECFSAMYGDPKAVLARQQHEERFGQLLKNKAPQNVRSAGGDEELVCHVCRKRLELSAAPQTGNKSSRLTGSADSSMGTHDSFSSPGSSFARTHLVDANGDDKAEPARSSEAMLRPTLTLDPEFTTLCRRDPPSNDATQTVSAVVRVAVPGRRQASKRNMSKARSSISSAVSSLHPTSLNSLGASAASPRRQRGGLHPLADGFSLAPPVLESEGKDYARIDKALYDLPEEEAALSSSPIANTRPVRPDKSPRRNSAAAASSLEAPLSAEALRKQVKDDLRERVVDWKGHNLEHFGELYLTDTLSVFQDQMVRKFNVYLFEQAILCALEGRSDSSTSHQALLGLGEEGKEDHHPAPAKPPLRLKGRIYLRHLHSVANTSTVEQPSLSIRMIDPSMDVFVLVFESERQAMVWRDQITALMDSISHPTQETQLVLPHDLTGQTGAMEFFPMPPGFDMSPAGDDDAPPRSSSSSNRPTLSRTSSHRSAASTAQSTTAPWFPSMAASGRPLSMALQPLPPRPDQPDWRSVLGFDPTVEPPRLYPHTSVDLVIMVAVPPLPDPMGGVSDSLKLGLLRSTLQFLVDSMGEKDRISLVAFRPGLRSQGGFVAKTRLLRLGVDSSRRSLTDFLELLAVRALESSEKYVEDLSQYIGAGANPDRVDSTSALNVGLDVMLQRLSKNPIAGMMLIDDSASAPRRTSMDLVLTRSGAAGVPIHCFGLGPKHDPSSMWLISDHTGGTYTYIHRTTELREAAAGCVGSLLSVALTDVQVRITLPPDNKMRIRRAVGSTAIVVSADGKNADVSLGTIHYGDAREILLALEYNFAELYASLAPSGSSPGDLSDRSPSEQPQPNTALGASDDYLAQFGFDAALLNPGPMPPLMSPDNIRAFGVDFVEDLVVLEADLAFRDPATLQAATRLSPDGPVKLALEIDGSRLDTTASLPPATLAAVAKAEVTRRRFEILASEMITRSLHLVSRQSLDQACLILQKTRRMIESILTATPGYTATSSLPPLPPTSMPPTSPSHGEQRNSSSSLGARVNPALGVPTNPAGPSSFSATTNTAPAPPATLSALPPHVAPPIPSAPVPAPPTQAGHQATIDTLSAILEDLDTLTGLMAQDLTSAPAGGASATMLRATARMSTLSSGSGSSAMHGMRYEREGRAFAAQQAMVLRGQKAWTRRTATEYLYFRDDNGPALAALASISSAPA